MKKARKPSERPPGAVGLGRRKGTVPCPAAGLLLGLMWPVVTLRGQAVWEGPLVVLGIELRALHA